MKAVMSFCSPCCADCPTFYDDGSIHDDYGNIGRGAPGELEVLVADAQAGVLAARCGVSTLHPERPIVLQYGGAELHFSQEELAAFVAAAHAGVLTASRAA